VDVQVVDVRLLLPLARLLDIGGLDVRYERAPGGFEMFATAVNDGEVAPARSAA
jgi:hypothetical protein